MKNNYRVQANATNPDFEPESRIKEGIECAGFLLITFNENGEPMTEAMAGISIDTIARFIATNANGNGMVANNLRQAAIIAEGYLKAMKIEEQYQHERRLKEIQKHIEGMTNKDLIGEEDEDETADTDD